MPGRSILRVAFAVALISFASRAFAAPILLRLDATEAPRKIYHAELTIPASPGPMTLFYPKWIPGEHAPTGPITDLAGLRMTSGDQTVTWKRDSVEMFAFHITVPPRASSVDVKLDFLSTPEPAGFTSAASATSELAILSWNQMILYPRGQASDELEVSAQVRLPDEWNFGTALPVLRRSGNSIEFKTVSLTTLVDSPVLAGRHFRSIELSPGAPIVMKH